MDRDYFDLVWAFTPPRRSAHPASNTQSIDPPSGPHVGGHQRIPLGHQHPRIHRAGLGGGGGIGVKLEGALATLAWPKVSMLLILILVMAVFSEWVTAKVREKLI
jgi:hypothetical protein